MLGAVFWSLLAHFLSRHAAIIWAQRGLALVSVLFLVCCCALAPASPAHAHSHDDADDEEQPTTNRPHAHGRGVATALTDHALLVALFLLYAGASMTCTFVTPLALRAGVAPTTAGFAQVGMYSVGLAGYFMMGDMERAVSRKWILVAAAVVSGCQIALFPLMLSTPVVLLFFCQLGLFLAMLMATTPPYFLQSISCGRGARLQLVASSIGFLLGGPVCGFVEDIGKGWVGGSVVCMATLLGGSLALATTLTCKRTLRRRL
ncbi:Major facilitator superfamily domain, general substrate transporter [Cordyceps fumosorosea ARSEF 2679]|uniref:Major facilitator superfamily domain, general substrate transporter n=1 Tax=Cordyceps fumosorosea (strain ARSEF 2679) TaxID=1081104 RepID=A0A166XBY5_CORFA|nr:Major facilitator superfamily domain, general substrate transporter [Cordyceps fumosorosea ARSEF 2679]OAA35644.1 Major facilitator superfamily domain, general substrate transporter [Cordyceps fumosorosea ARSEF 2679]